MKPEFPPEISPNPGPVFVERQTYRHRRMVDAARLLPIFGVGLLCIPLLWSGSKSTTFVMVYIFGVWALLAGASYVISRHLRPEDDSRRSDRESPKEGR